MTRVLVTGGTGFIGSWCCAGLDAKGWDIRIFDSAPDASKLDFVKPGLASRVTFVTGDIRDAAVVAHAMEGCDAVVHLVGMMTVACARDPQLGTAVNLTGSLNVFAAALAHGVRRVAYLSSAGVYGPGSSIHPRPMTHYGALKLAVEGCARSFWADHGLPSTGFRPYIVYGAGESSGIAAGPSIACRAAVAGERAEIRFNGLAGFVHVGDVARALIQSIEQDGDGAHVHDLNGETAAMTDLVSMLEEMVPGSRTTISGEPLRIPPRIEGGDHAPWLEMLGVTSLREGLGQTVAHWQAQEV